MQDYKFWRSTVEAIRNLTQEKRQYVLQHVAFFCFIEIYVYFYTCYLKTKYHLKLIKMKNWERTTNSKIVEGVEVRQIRLTKDCYWGKKGDLGGWIFCECCLYGNAWITKDAAIISGGVSGNALVTDNAIIDGGSVRDNARIYGNARIEDGQIIDNAEVYGNAVIYEHARIGGAAKVYGNAEVAGDEVSVNCDAKVHGNSGIYSRAHIGGSVEIDGDIEIGSYAEITGSLKLEGKMTISGYLHLTSPDKEVNSTLVDQRVFDNVKIADEAKVALTYVTYGYRIDGTGTVTVI